MSHETIAAIATFVSVVSLVYSVSRLMRVVDDLHRRVAEVERAAGGAAAEVRRVLPPPFPDEPPVAETYDYRQPIGWRETRAGYIVDAISRDSMRQPDDDGPTVSTYPDDDGTIRAIRRVAGVIDRDDLGAECIGELPAETL